MYIIKIYNNIILNKYVINVIVVWFIAQFYAVHGPLMGRRPWVGDH
jgi:hypothetical protein